METTETKTIGKYKIEIFPDEDPMNPRENGNLGTMVCFNRRHNLGDKHNYGREMFDSWEEMEKHLIKTENTGVILPLAIFDHSGISMYVGSSVDYWDGSRVGFIFISKEKMCKEYGYKRISKKLTKKVEEYLRGEVEEYSQYLSGDCYGFRITDTDTEEQVDSCWGYYGNDYCMKEAESIVNSFIEQDKKVESIESV